MNEGYVIENGESYYCSIQCLNQDISDKEYYDLFDDGNGETYWTQWEDDYEFELINNILTKIE
jgi:hypothetical protein